MATTTRINRVAWDFANIQYAINIYEEIGDESRILVANVPIGAAVKEINYEPKIEFEDMMGSSREPQDTTEGVGNYEGSMVLEKYGADFLAETIDTIDGHGLGTVRLGIAVAFYKKGLDPKTDTIHLARITSWNNAYKAGKEVSGVSIGLKPKRVFIRSKSIFGDRLV